MINFSELYIYFAIKYIPFDIFMVSF